MSNFTWPDWKPLPVEPPPPPIDPAQARENKIADNTRAEEAGNLFLGTRQSVLFTGPDAFFAKKGSDAIKAAPGVWDRLGQAKDDLLDGLGNHQQRLRAGSMLDAQMRLTRDDVVRHVSDQYLAWQRQTAQNRIDGLTQEAALHHNDDGRIDATANAAALAARAKARVGDQPPDSDTENASADWARSGVLNSAVQARLDAGNTSGASDLYDRVKDQLDPSHAGSLGAQIDTAQRFQAAKDYADGLMPEVPSATPDEIEAQRAAATRQNQADNSDDPAHQRLAQHFIDVGFDGQQNDLQQAKAARDEAVENWIATPAPDGKPQTAAPPPALWNKLSPDEQAAVFARLGQNAQGVTGVVPVQYKPDQNPDAGEQIAQTPTAGANRGNAKQPAKLGTTSQRTNLVIPPEEIAYPSAKSMAAMVSDFNEALPVVREAERREAVWEQMIRRLPYAGPRAQEPLPENWKPKLNEIDLTYADLTEKAAAKYGIPPLLLARLFMKESNYNRYLGIDRQTLTPSEGPMGIPQMYEGALNAVGTTPAAFAKASPEAQINAGAAYLAQQYKAFRNWPKAVAAYHHGAGAMGWWFSGRGPRLEAVDHPAGDRDKWAALQAELSYVFGGDPKQYDKRQ
jgi:hypothetical protein